MCHSSSHCSGCTQPELARGHVTHDPGPSLALAPPDTLAVAVAAPGQTHDEPLPVPVALQVVGVGRHPSPAQASHHEVDQAVSWVSHVSSLSFLPSPFSLSRTVGGPFGCAFGGAYTLEKPVVDVERPYAVPAPAPVVRIHHTPADLASLSHWRPALPGPGTGRCPVRARAPVPAAGPCARRGASPFAACGAVGAARTLGPRPAPGSPRP
jgi:hypothetical protein